MRTASEGMTFHFENVPPMNDKVRVIEKVIIRVLPPPQTPN
jgi:hypothetical protein